MTRSLPPKRRSKPRRGRVRDFAYLVFLHDLPCLLSGRGDTQCAGYLTCHHVRFCGSMRDDFRTVPLCCAHHIEGCGNDSIERLGRRKWEEKFGIDLEAAIVNYNAAYELQKSREFQHV